MSVDSEDSVRLVKGIYQVLPYLWIGNADVATSEKDELKRLKITDILNCASEDVDNFWPDDFKYHSFPLEDTHDCSAAEYFDKAYDIISGVKDSSTRIFVHCTSGHNIAPTIVLSYMLKSSKNQNKHLPLSQALKYIAGKAPGAEPENQFLSDLIDLEVELFEDASVNKGRKSGGRGGYSRGKGKRGK
jgi:hypothetical protein